MCQDRDRVGCEFRVLQDLSQQVGQARLETMKKLLRLVDFDGRRHSGFSRWKECFYELTSFCVRKKVCLLQDMDTSLGRVAVVVDVEISGC